MGGSDKQNENRGAADRADAAADQPGIFPDGTDSARRRGPLQRPLGGQEIDSSRMRSKLGDTKSPSFGIEWIASSLSLDLQSGAQFAHTPFFGSRRAVELDQPG